MLLLSAKARTVLLALSVSWLWMLCFPLLDLGLRHATPLWFATLRGAAAGLVLLAWALATGRSWPRTWPDGIRIAAIATLSTSIGYGSMFVGGGLVPVGAATVLANTQPVWAAILAVLVLRERCSLRRGSQLALAFVGVALLAGVDFQGFTLGLGAVLLLNSAMALAAGNLLIKSLANRTDAVVVSGLQLSLGSIPLGLAAWRYEPAPSLPAATEFWVALIVLAVASTALGAVIWQKVLARAPLNQINAVSFLIPVYGLPLMLIYGNSVSMLQWFGAALAAAGVVAVLFDHGKADEAPPVRIRQQRAQA